jgi:hypothetical protein
MMVQIGYVVLTEELMVLHWAKLRSAEYEAQILKLIEWLEHCLI